MVIHTVVFSFADTQDKDNDLILKVGHTFTIEPGIYLPDYGGVRVEDDVVITETGCRSFSTLPREMIRICD